MAKIKTARSELDRLKATKIARQAAVTGGSGPMAGRLAASTEGNRDTRT
jgi:hypothetical protein